MINPSIVQDNAPKYANVGTLYSPEGTLIYTMNPGLLSIASYLLDKNKKVDIVDLLDQKNLNLLEKQCIEDSYRIVGISCMSGFSYPSTLKIAEFVKSIDPGCRIKAVTSDHRSIRDKA